MLTNVNNGPAASGEFLLIGGALRRACKSLDIATPGVDPAPWIDASKWERDAAIIRDRKLLIRASDAMVRAFLNGGMCAKFLRDETSIEVPGWAWEGIPAHSPIWTFNVLQLDGTLPDEWYRWSGAQVILPLPEFEYWLQSTDWSDLAEPDAMPVAYDLDARPGLLTFRLPPDTPYVSLAEALSWASQEVSICLDRLYQALDFGSFPVTELDRACHRLLAFGTAGQIEFRGKHVEHYGDNGHNARTEIIPPLSLTDYAGFNPIHDGLDFGSGVAWNNQGVAFADAFRDMPRDCYRYVTVNRADLLKRFPPANAYLVEGLPPAVAIGSMTMPGEDFDPWEDVPVSPWWSALQAIGWVAIGSKAYPAYIAELETAGRSDLAPVVIFSATNIYLARKHCKCAAQHLATDSRWEQCTCTGDAGRRLLEAIRTGKVTPIQQTASGPNKLQFHDLVGVGQRSTGIDWLDLAPSLRFSSAEIIEHFPAASKVAEPPETVLEAMSVPTNFVRSPAVKAGRSPSDQAIRTKADEMKQRGIRHGRVIARDMRLELGFENVATTYVRELIKGRYTGGRVKAGGAD